ncbi:extracellular solute-binding protein [Kiritimatiellota bacterium B12222]|nr:extracellular solute-binding protein [Kiritimatiellota bacterium B12222]
MSKLFWTLLCFGIFTTTVASAQTIQIPPEGWEPEPSPFASEWAEPGGTVKVYASQYPASFNYYLDQNVFSSRLFSYQFESLIGQNGLSLEPEPGLASRLEISEDQLTFTFYLDEKAQWSDGRPVTADDVIWTFNAIMDPSHPTGPHKVGLDRFEVPVKIDDRSVQFTAKEVHWGNIWACGGFSILPSHWWKDQDFNKTNFVFPVVSGPYEISQLNEPHSVVLSKRDDYWAIDDPRGEGLTNFDEIEFRFYAQRDTAFDNFKAGNFDLFAVYTAKRWASETSGKAFDQNWIIKQAIHNLNPTGFQGFAMNMRNPLFQDLRVRKALAMLLDRQRMNETLMFNQYELTASYFPDLYPEGNPNPLVEYNVTEALRLLNEAGWSLEKGKLTKDGKPFVLTFLTRDPSSNRFLLIYRKSLEQVGIELVIDQKDWASWAKDMNEYNYDMTWASWSAGLFKDPESMWHSKYVDAPSGFNITGLKNEKVDALIDSIGDEFDVEKRHEVVREIDALLVAEQPYILLWHTNYVRLLYWNRFDMPDQVLTLYGSESAAQSLWWTSPDLNADLEAAKKSGRKLPGRPSVVNISEGFLTVPAEPLQ